MYLLSSQTYVFKNGNNRVSVHKDYYYYLSEFGYGPLTLAPAYSPFF